MIKRSVKPAVEREQPPISSIVEFTEEEYGFNIIVDSRKGAYGLYPGDVVQFPIGVLAGGVEWNALQLVAGVRMDKADDDSFVEEASLIVFPITEDGLSIDKNYHTIDNIDVVGYRGEDDGDYEVMHNLLLSEHNLFEEKTQFFAIPFIVHRRFGVEYLDSMTQAEWSYNFNRRYLEEYS